LNFGAVPELTLRQRLKMSKPRIPAWFILLAYLPAIIPLWIIGWSLYWIGTVRNKPTEAKR
jgi:hypothetical protein